MRTVTKAIGIVLACGVVIVGATVLGSRWIFGPLAFFPGPKLSGPVAQEPAEGWAFVDEVAVVQIETRPDNPYSNNIWLTRIDDGIYIFGGNEETVWVQNLAQDPRLRLRVEGRIYERRAVRTEDPEDKRRFIAALKAKYEGDFGYDPEWEKGDFILLRLDPR